MFRMVLWTVLFVLSSIAMAKTPIVSGYQYTVNSDVLAEPRRYFVSLPERYYAENRKYPVLYIIDADFQFQHVSATVTNLTRMGKIAPMIVVGIANQGPDDYVFQTTWPAEESADFGGAANYYRHIEQELVPLVNKQFRTSNKRALAGYSLGGLFALYALTQSDTTFNAFIAMSPSLWFDNYSLNEKITKVIKQEKSTAPLFISVANEQGMGVAELNEQLTELKKSNWLWQFKHYPTENHFSTALPALIDALTFLSPNHYEDFYAMDKMKNYQEVLLAFKQKKQYWPDYTIGWLQAYTFSKYIFRSKQQDHIDQILTQIKADFPNAYTEVLVQLAKGYNKKNNAKKALELLMSIQQLGQKHVEWHKQLSDSYQVLNKPDQAKQHKQRAIALAKEYQLQSWEVWELM